MNCPSCNFKNIEENRFCIMCGTPLEGGGAGGDTTGSLDLSASLPGAGDIDFSGLMDQVQGDGAGLFDDLDGGGNEDGSLDLMLSDFEGNLASLAGGGDADEGAVPPPSGGEGWGASTNDSSPEDFSFSDLSALDPARSEDISLPDGGLAAAGGSGDPLDFSFDAGDPASVGAAGGGGAEVPSVDLSQGDDFGGLDLGEQTAADFDLSAPAGGLGFDEPTSGGGDLGGLDFGGAESGAGLDLGGDAGGLDFGGGDAGGGDLFGDLGGGADPGSLDFGSIDEPAAGGGGGIEDGFSDDSMAELNRFQDLASPAPSEGAPAGGGDDELEDLLAEIEDLPAGPGGAGAESGGDLDGFGSLFGDGAAEAAGAMAVGGAAAAAASGGDDMADLFGGGGEPTAEPAAAEPPSLPDAGDDMMASGLVFDEQPKKEDPLAASLPGFDDFDTLFEEAGGTPAAPAASAGGDDLDDFLAELEGTASTPKVDASQDIDLDGILPGTDTPEPPAAPAATAAATVQMPARPGPAPSVPSADASDDEIAALIGAMEVPSGEDPEPPVDLLDPGEAGPPSGSSLDDFLDEITTGVMPPDPAATGPHQPLSPVSGPLTSVPGRLEEVDPKALLKQLEGTRDEDRRYQIVQRLAQLQHEDTVPDFLRFLNDSNEDIRACAAEALGNLGDLEAVHPLLKSLQTERGNMRYLCVEALGRLGDAQATEPLIQLLGEDDENMVYVVAEALGRIGNRKAVRPLMGLAGTADKDLRYIVAKSLGAIGSTEATPLLLQLLRDDDREVRLQAIHALGELEDPDGAGALLDFLDEDEDPEIALAAVRSLGRIRARVAVRPLLGLLKTMREELAVEVIHALGRIGAVEAVMPIVTRLQDDPAVEVQRAGIEALGQLGDAEAVPALVQVLESGREPLKVPIAEALARLHVPEALAPLEELLQDADVVVRQHAVEGIGALQTPASVSHLERLVRDPDEGVREAVAQALGAIGTEECLPLLLALLSDPHSGVSDSAVDGLEAIGTPAVPTLIGALTSHEDNPELLAKVVRVLGSIGDIRGINPLLEAFEDADREMRGRVAEALVAIDAKLVDSGRIATLVKEGYAWVRFRIAGALGREGMSESVRLLLDVIEETYTDADEARLRNFPDAGILLVNREALEGVRAAAASLLGDMNLPDTVKQVLGRLVKADGRTRLWLVRTLGYVQKEASVSALIELLKKDDSGIPAAFLGKVLRRIPLASTVDRVLGAVATANATVRARCAEVLGVLADTRALGKLSELTRDADEEVRLAALGALEKIGSNQAFDALAKAVKDVSSAVRRRAVEALLTLPDDRAISVLGTALQDRVADVRGAAAAALGSIKDKRVVPILLAGLKDESSEVRLSIVNTLGELGDREAVRPLMQMLQDINSEVRQSAVRALGRIGDIEAVPSLLQAMDDHDLWVKTESRKTLLAFGEEALPRKIEALGSDDAGLQAAAVTILAEQSSPRLYSLLLESFRHRSKVMRANSAKVLGMLRETKAVVPLIHLLDDRDFEVREKAAVALGQIGDISASVALKHAQKDQNKDVRVAAHAALKRIMELADVG